MIDIGLFDAAIFDMDGTIIDSLGVWEKIDREFLENRRGIEVPCDYVDAISAMSFTEIAEYTVKRFGLSDSPQALMDEWREMAEHEYAHNIEAKPYVREYLEKLRALNKKIVLCTSSPKSFFEGALKNNGIYGLFDAFSNTCEAGEGKNSPAVYLLAAKKVDTEPERCLVFEDILSAAVTAKKAGMTVCGVFDKRSEMHKDKMKKVCDCYIEGFDELI